MTKVPKNLITTALKTPRIPSVVVCAEQNSILESVKEASEINLIEPILIGKEDRIKSIANKINFNIENFNIINEQSEIKCASLG